MNEPLFDRSVLASLAGLGGPGQDPTPVIMAMFERESTARATRLIAAAVARDRDGIVREAHRILGAAATVGAVRLAAAARALEQIVRDNGAWTDVDAACRVLIAAANETLAARPRSGPNTSGASAAGSVDAVTDAMTAPAPDGRQR